MRVPVAALVLVFLAAVGARVAHSVWPIELAILCDGIDDEDGGLPWFLAKTSEDEDTARSVRPTQKMPRERQVASVYRGAAGQREGALGSTSLLFRPRLFAARPTGTTDSATPG